MVEGEQWNVIKCLRIDNWDFPGAGPLRGRWQLEVAPVKRSTLSFNLNIKYLMIDLAALPRFEG